jgi:hypothetical protein
VRLKRKPQRLEVQRLVYAKYLFNEGRRYLQNKDVAYHYNISVVLAANALDVFVNTLAYCFFGQDHTKEHISSVVKKLSSAIKTFPNSETNRVLEARNGIYHRVELKDYQTCNDLNETTERVLRRYYREYFKKDYDRISMVDLISDGKIQALMRKSENHLTRTKFPDAIITACEAFSILEKRVSDRAHYQIPDRDSDLLWGTEISWRHMESSLGIEKRGITFGKLDVSDLLRLFSQHTEEQVNKKMVRLARRFNLLLMLGELYEDYKHYDMIKPLYHQTLGGFRYEREGLLKRNYTQKEAQFIFDFVLESVLRIEPRLKPVEVRTIGGVVRRVD